MLWRANPVRGNKKKLSVASTPKQENEYSHSWDQSWDSSGGGTLTSV